MLVTATQRFLGASVMVLIGCAPVQQSSKSATLGAPAPGVGSVSDPSNGNALRFRTVGPMRGGRVTTVTGVPSEPKTYYMGTTGGGIWRTTDAGESWVNVSDGQIPLGSMGSVEVSLSNPSIIWVG